MLDLIQTRRDLHQIPEIGLEEFKTQAYLLDVIEKLITGKDFVQIRTWRTDIDGLPIIEQTGLPFASQHQGRMHACGHDFHMTIALGCLERALEEQPKNNLLFLFQPPEENEAGGMLLYES